MILRAALIALLLATLGLVAFAPTGSATCLDTNPDDNGVGTQGCNLPVSNLNNCKVLVYGSIPGTSGCSQIYCIREPCW